MPVMESVMRRIHPYRGTGRARFACVLIGAFACDVSAVAGTAGTLPPSGGSPQNFSAQYILSSVQPDPFVPATGFTLRSVIGRCVEIKSDGTVVQDVLYSQDSPAALLREVDNWTYTLSGTDIMVNNPIGFGSGPVVQRVGSTNGTVISITRVLRNSGLAVIKTLIFSRVSQVDPRCGS